MAALKAEVEEEAASSQTPQQPPAMAGPREGRQLMATDTPTGTRIPRGRTVRPTRRPSDAAAATPAAAGRSSRANNPHSIALISRWAASRAVCARKQRCRKKNRRAAEGAGHRASLRSLGQRVRSTGHPCGRRRAFVSEPWRRYGVLHGIDEKVSGRRWRCGIPNAVGCTRVGQRTWRRWSVGGGDR